MKRIFDWLNRNERKIHILASIATIIALIFALWTFKSEIDFQRNYEFNEHLSNIKGLQLELEKNIELMSDLFNWNEESNSHEDNSWAVNIRKFKKKCD